MSLDVAVFHVYLLMMVLELNQKSKEKGAKPAIHKNTNSVQYRLLSRCPAIVEH
jgi:hypothetical protein